MSIRKALGISALAQFTGFLLNLAGVMVISRLLTPDEIGLFSVAMAFVGFAHIFRDFGIGQYLIRAERIGEAEIRSAFTVMLASSWAIAAILVLARKPLAAFYGNDGIAQVLLLLAANILVLPFAAPLLSVLKRELRFGKVALVTLTGQLVQTATTIGAALVGESSLSMAWGSLFGSVTNVAMLWMLRPQGVLLLPTRKGLREVIRFGFGSTGVSLASEVGDNAPDLIFGRTLGFAAVGYYSRASGLMSMVLGQVLGVVRGVFFPVFADGVRRGLAPDTQYASALAYIVGFTAPLLALAALLAGPLIGFFFGDRWDRAAPLASWLCTSALLLTPFAMANASMIACDKLRITLVAQIAIQSVRILVLFSSLFLELEHVVIALTFASFASFHILRIALKKAIGLRFHVLWASIRTSYALIPFTLVGPAMAMLAARGGSFGEHPFWILAASAILASIGWLTGIALMGHPLKGEILRLALTIRDRWADGI